MFWSAEGRRRVGTGPTSPWRLHSSLLFLRVLINFSLLAELWSVRPPFTGISVALGSVLAGCHTSFRAYRHHADITNRYFLEIYSSVLRVCNCSMSCSRLSIGGYSLLSWAMSEIYGQTRRVRNHAFSYAAAVHDLRVRKTGAMSPAMSAMNARIQPIKL